MNRNLALSVLFLSTGLTAFAAAPDQDPLAGHRIVLSPGEGDQPVLAGSTVRSFLSAIHADDFQVTPGKLLKPNILQLVCMGITTSCNGNNNANPYLLVHVPLPGDVYDPLATPLNFTMRQDEAIVLIGRTPPPAAYFSFRTFSMYRYVERESLRRKVFPSLGDPNNMLTFNTLGKAKGDPYDKAFVLVIVSDKGTESRVRNALKAAGFPDAIINRDVVSPNLARMSSKANGDTDPDKDDDFVGLMRLALWDYGYEDAGAAYLADPPVAVLRLTPTPRTEKAKYAPLPVERLRPRGTGITEMDLMPSVNALRDAIVAKYPSMKADDLRPTTWLEESFVAQQKDLDVLGESRDTVYLKNEGSFRLEEDDFVMVYGVNHEATGKSTYANFAAYNLCNACPFGGENSRRVAGSALEYFPDPGTRPSRVEDLYAWKLARKCGGDPRCTQIAVGTTCLDGIALAAQMFVGFRAYVEPSTMIGPAFSEIVYDRVLRFTPSAPTISDVTLTSGGTPVPRGGVAAGSSVEIKFRVTASTDSTGLSWTASVKNDDGCARFSASSGTMEKSGDVTISLTTVPPNAIATLSVFLNATDGKDRRAKTYGTLVKFK